MRQCGRGIRALAHICGVAVSGAAPTVTVTTTTVRTRMYATSTPVSGDSNSSAASPATDAQMQRDIFNRAMTSGDATDGFTEERHVTPGSSDEDVFGHKDPLMAVEQTVQEASTKAAQQTSQVAREVKGESTTSRGKAKDDLANEIDQVVSSRNRRRNRRKRSMDAILGDVLHDALLMRDMGEKPTSDFVYKRTQERVYEEEYGRKPPSAKETASQCVPFPPDFHMHRLLPLFGDVTAAADGAEPVVSEAKTDAADTAQRPATQAPIYTKNHMNVHTLVPPDPWPERSVTPANPVWTRRDLEEDKNKTGGKGLKEWEERMFAPRPHYDLPGEFLDAMDELAYWERRFLVFLRAVPISQRRSLPFLHEWYRLLVHRVVRAERRYIRVRDALLSKSKASAAVFAQTEKVIDDVRSYYAETHRSLASPNYDPLRMKKSVLAPVLRMTDAEFEEWQEEQRQRRNALVAELS
ncbi:putative mitochondrial hypothetical protein [Leptomonas pyrrhocoris]|uniref:Uncharacterized protein n=1 Tax=Leptomonas pyrrhocoris TaxID=157538 RepID=A0A0M9GAF8_LEPPY|nr:putative mitochondrial hypothetical protein [Leptomonas pyrrhocoris]XP_015664633.1 putative mitochondrial hypothetical protein [Leptomonas pyrrhocoris]KPA86193.1 putative mitochondrial hypothetical protein [Leptomonas pyrrhocoris]KPA86194.1 putative mitochondrial hypothetical protein [Leptomonas pyrrhocoris]|eukprot:XP_015664632.1 putative mitochondrial hypothetical protein [Leptomonas pyrrhocoris]